MADAVRALPASRIVLQLSCSAHALDPAESALLWRGRYIISHAAD